MRGRATNTMNTSSVDRIAQLAGVVSQAVPGLFAENKDHITEAINAIIEESHETEDGKAILSLSISIKWDLNGPNIVLKLPVTVKRTAETTVQLDDPNQPTLPFCDADGDAMPDSAANAVRKLANKIRDGHMSITMGEAAEAKRAVEAAREVHDTMRAHGATVTMLNGGDR